MWFFLVSKKARIAILIFGIAVSAVVITLIVIFKQPKDDFKPFRLPESAMAKEPLKPLKDGLVMMNTEGGGYGFGDVVEITTKLPVLLRGDVVLFDWRATAGNARAGGLG